MRGTPDKLLAVIPSRYRGNSNQLLVDECVHNQSGDSNTNFGVNNTNK